MQAHRSGTMEPQTQRPRCHTRKEVLHMASLRDSVKNYQDELRDGIAWVAFWKQGRSWNAELFHLEVDGTLEPFDRSRLEEIKAADPAAVILNGYYCGHLGEDFVHLSAFRLRVN